MRWRIRWGQGDYSMLHNSRREAENVKKWLIRLGEEEVKSAKWYLGVTKRGVIEPVKVKESTP